MIEFRGLSLFKEKLGRLSKSRQFEKMSLLFQGAEYTMGNENMDNCDCSGLICGTLNLMGYRIRITADEIMRKLTKEYSSENTEEVTFIMCLKDGKCNHIGIVLQKGEADVIYNSSYPTGVQFETPQIFLERYRIRGYTIAYMYLDWNKVKDMDGVAYGLDKELV